MGIPRALLDEMLRSKFAGTHYLGLIAAGGREIDQDNYQREAVTMDAEGTAPAAVYNMAEVRFHPVAAPVVVTGWFLVTATGEELVRKDLAASKRFAVGDRPFFEPGALRVEILERED